MYDTYLELGAEAATERRPGYQLWACMDQAMGVGALGGEVGGEEEVTSKAGGMTGGCQEYIPGGGNVAGRPVKNGGLHFIGEFLI